MWQGQNSPYLYPAGQNDQKSYSTRDRMLPANSPAYSGNQAQIPEFRQQSNDAYRQEQMRPNVTT